MPSIKPFDIVVNPVGSKFAKALQRALVDKVESPVYRRASPKILPARRAVVSRKGNVLRQGRSQSVRQHFLVTQRPLNKVEQFEKFTEQGISCPRFTLTSANVGELGKTVFARTLINATNGRGIVEFEPASGGHIPRAPLYTEYIPKKAEYRFHVFGSDVIDIQQKKKKREFNEDERDTRIRNLHNGYIYSRDGVNPPNGAADLAIRAVAALGYQYGAVDLIYNEKRNQCYVLEVNSRPGIINSTCDSYANAIIDYYGLTRKRF